MSLAYDIYAGPDGGGPVDYTHPIATTASLTAVVSGPTPGSSRRYGVRARDTSTGLREQNTDAQLTVASSSRLHGRGELREASGDRALPGLRTGGVPIPGRDRGAARWGGIFGRRAGCECLRRGIQSHHGKLHGQGVGARSGRRAQFGAYVLISGSLTERTHMLRSIIFAALLLIANANAFGQTAERYWIDLTTSPGEQGYGRIVDGWAVDITARRPKATTTPVVPTTNAVVSSEATMFLMAVNAWRAQHGRGPLRWDAGLAAYASTNCGIHAPGSSGGAPQCWAGTSSLTAALGMWQRSGPHASILLNAASAIGAARCPSGATANAR